MPKHVRIGIDGRMLGPNPKGISKYVTELCIALESLLPSAEFFVYAREEIKPPVASERWHLRVEDSRQAQRMPKSLWLALRTGYMSRSDNLDVFWGGTGILPLFGLRTKAVLTVHDVVYRIVPKTCCNQALWSARL